IAVHWDTYIKRLRIEAQTLLDVQSKQILPAALAYRARCAREVYDTELAGVDALKQRDILNAFSLQCDALISGLDNLKTCLKELSDAPTGECGRAWHARALPLMGSVRAASDALETLMPGELWPVPTYGEMLFYV
ncbi:MAG: hypothetical protein FWF47_00850, partial [Clostridia bacterium]|nr:hypothetical protein [Clostridia bacterium]